MGANDFVKGRTNNHLTWVMVDATDAFTPESALSAATKIKIYGKLRGAAGVNFVSSGTGSLANDIQHVGASALGIYTIALTKPDLSDASAAWYDQYVISLSATGAAFQTLIVDGGIDVSALLALSDAVSNVMSAVLLTQSMASDAASAAAQANSRVLLVQSRLSDFDSRMVSDISDVRSMLSDMMSDFQSRVPKRVATDSQLSDLHSDLRSFLVVMSGIQSDLYSQLSDFRSDLHSFVSTTGVGLHASALSDLRSAIAAGPAATITASDISDIASAVWANTIGARVDSRVLVIQSAASDIYSRLSDALSGAMTASDLSDIASAVWAHTIGTRVDSRVLLTQSMTSDLQSKLSDVESNLLSLITTTGVQLNASTLSDLRSAITAITATVSASDMSDIASLVDVLLASRLSDILSAAQQTNSRVLVVQSQASDLASKLSDVESNLLSLLVTTGVNLNTSVLSDLRSAITGVAATVSASDISDIASAVWAHTIGARVDSRVLLAQSMASDAASAAQQASSRVLVVQSMVSDTQSKLSDVESNLLSLLVTTGVNLNTSVMSDIRSAVTAVTVNLTASDISDIASAVAAAVTTITASDISDIASRVDAVLASRLSDILSAAQQANSRILLTQSMTSDVQSALAVVQSLASDAHSAAAAANTAATAGASRALLNQSRISDVYSMLSDLQSDFGSRVPKRVATDSQLSALTADVISALAAGVPVSASDMSDLRSAIAAGTLTASAISDIASAVAVEIASRMSDILSAAQQTNSRVALVQSTASDIYSQVLGGVELGASSLSDLRSAITANGVLRAGADIAGTVSPTATLAEKVDWITGLSRNKVVQTATLQKVYDDSGNQVASATVAGDATSTVRQEFAG